MTHPFDALDLDRLHRRRSVKWQAFGSDVLPLWVAEMDYPIAAPIQEALADLVANSDTGYAHRGTLPEAYAEFAAERWSLEVDPSWAVIVPDVMQGIRAVLHGLLPGAAQVVVSTPAYPPFFHHIRDEGRRLVEVPLAREASGRYGFDFEALEAAFRSGAAAYLLNNPHNPTGRVFTRPELEAVAALADRYGVQVLADEIHAPLVYPGHEHVPFVTVDADAARTAITFTSASKGWNLAGLKAALAVAADASVADRLLALPDEVGYGASLFGIVAGEVAFRSGRDWLADVVGYLDTNRMALAALLAEHLPGVGYIPPEGTYLGWLDCRPLGLGANPAADLLLKGRVALESGVDFGRPGEGFARINLATSRALLEEGVRRMAMAVGDREDLRP